MDRISLHTDRDFELEGGYWDQSAGDRVVKFFVEILFYPLLDWQECYLRTLFSWKRSNGLRRFTRSALFVPKRNGKSFLLSGISLYCAIADGEIDPQVMIGACDREQASIIYEGAKKLYQGSPVLCDRLVALDSRKTIKFPQGNATIKALSSDAPSKHGTNPSVLLLDEIHAYKNRNLVEALQYNLSNRKQPLTIIISTAGTTVDQQQIGFLEYQRAKRVLNGESDLYYLPVVYEASPDDDIESEETWKKANPSYGIVFSSDSFKEEFEQAKRNPIELANWKRLKLNLWSKTNEVWIDPTEWSACSSPLSVDELRQENQGQLCYMAVDLSRSADLTAISMLFPKEDGNFDVIVEAFLAKELGLKKEKFDKVPYGLWADQGFVTFTDGNTVDYEFICGRIIELCQEFNVQEVAYDRWQARYLLPLFEKFGVVNGGTPLVDFPAHAFYFTEPIAEFDKLVQARKIRHGNNPLLNWQIGHCELRTKGVSGEFRQLYKGNQINRIDNIWALVAALGRYLVAPPIENVLEEEVVDWSKAFSFA